MMNQNQPLQPNNDSTQVEVAYNWEALKTEFMQGPWKTTGQFRKDKNMPDTHFILNRMRHWATRKKYMVDDMVKEDSGEIVELNPKEIELARQRQAEHARFLQRKGLDALEVFEPKTVEDARKLVVSGLQEERAALGFSEKGGPSNLTQVNVSLPKTKFDKIIGEEDFAGILKFIAEIKRERARRVRGVTS